MVSAHVLFLMPTLDSSSWKCEVEMAGSAKTYLHCKDQKGKHCNVIKTNSWRRTFPHREAKPGNHWEEAALEKGFASPRLLSWKSLFK